MIRSFIKTAVGSTCYWSGFNRLLARRGGIRNIPLVIGYHRVVPDFKACAASSIPPMLTSTRTFERQLDWMGKHYQFVTLDDVAAVMEGAKHFDRPVAAITFDDGYVDTYRHAWPILQRKGIPGAVFVVTDRIGSSMLQSYDELYLLLSLAYSARPEPRRAIAALLQSLQVPLSVSKWLEPASGDALHAAWALIEKLPLPDMSRVIEALRVGVEIPPAVKNDLLSMNWEMLHEMSRSGFIVGSHTCNHPLLTQEPWKRSLEEVRSSREVLQRRLGARIEHFAYPGGAYDEAVVGAVAAAGYRSAYTTCQHRDSRYPLLTIPRRMLWENACVSASGSLSTALLSCQVSGLFDFLPSCRQAHSF
jgi:peptidoglycan/xylan/chitin deacetylase (PgdA/CDA1 family)